MVKKFFLLLLVAMLNVVAWGADEVQITPPTDESSYKDGQYISTVGSTKFYEPTVRVYNESESKDVTGKYNISYSLKSNDIVGTSSFDDRGVEIITDNGTGSLNTGTTVEKYYGNVKMGTAGVVTIIVTATPKAGGDALASVKYDIHISPLPATPKFVPAFAAAEAPSINDGMIAVASAVLDADVADKYYISSGKSKLPQIKITTTNAGGVESDITNYFDITVTPKDFGTKLTYDNGYINYVGLGGSGEWNCKTSDEIDAEKVAIAALNATLVYTITPKSAYAGRYATITKTIDVKVNIADGKQDLMMSLTKDDFSNATVDPYEDGYKITVYKYPSSNAKYKVPVPSLKTSDGKAILPLGLPNDMKTVFKIVEDNTYFDDCRLTYNGNRDGEYQKSGEPTGLHIYNPTFQADKPGLVKVAMYGGMETTSDNIWALSEKEKIYNSKGTVTDVNGTEYKVFTDPVYFYIDVIKRKPSIVMTPNPEDLYFLKGDKIEMDSRFEISAKIESAHDGESGSLIWGANDGWSDHFAYQFFISDRLQSGHLHIDWYAYSAVGDTNESHPTWNTNGGDQYSFIDWHKPNYVGGTYPIQIGDIIKVAGETVEFTATEDFDVKTVGNKPQNLIGQTVTLGGVPVLVTPANIETLVNVKKGDKVELDKYVLLETASDVATYSATHSNLTTDDFERGITYNSMKSYGNENWEMTFVSEGTYNIPYTVRPWNHVKWDVSDEMTVKFEVKENKPTELLLSYYFQTATKSQSSFDEPSKKVVVPSENNLDITTNYNFSYSMTGTEGVDYEFDGTTYTHKSTNTTLDKTTGEVTIGDVSGDVHIQVSASHKSEFISSPYDNPEPKTYTIRIVDGTMASWEIISSCKTPGCVEYPEESGKQRFDFGNPADYASAMGRMHFLTAGDIYGGTVIEGVPGISMTIGAPAADEHALADWKTVATAEATPRCCDHETTPVIVRSEATVLLDEDGIPTAGAFYQFNPTVNGYLTVDAKYYKDRTIVLITRNKDGVVVDETFTNPGSGSEYTDGVKAQFDGAGNLLGDYTFKRPLIAGETYYLYDVSYSMEFNVHGFRYEPAFIVDRSTTIEQSKTPLSATTFMNSLSNSLPVLYKGKNENVAFGLSDAYGTGVTIGDFLELAGDDGALNPKAMTVKDGNVFKLRVTATVSSSKAGLGDCIKKTTSYDVSILDIPTYIIGNKATYDALGEEKTPSPGHAVTTENISTDITMTFGGWLEPVGEDGKYSTKGLADEWQYKSAAGPASRIGSEGDDDDPSYNKTVDGFNYFVAGLQNPVDEKNKGALQTGNNNSYNYGSGTEFETATDKYYNTTYRLPARGSFLKFEPRESGTLLLYLVQTGSCDYHYGLSEVGKTYQIKWRPLYITDETGKPVEMVDDFGAISQYLPTGTDMAHAGSFTLGVARCNKVEEEVKNSFVDKTNVIANCSFDWSEFRGTLISVAGDASDQKKLMDAWPAKGERESIVRLSNGGFALPHKAYVRYTFEVKAGKTYFVFQPGSKFEFGGFSFVPVGFPNECKYDVTSKPGALVYNATNQEKNCSGAAASKTETNASYDEEGIAEDKVLSGDEKKTGRDINFTWDTTTSRFTEDKENLVVTINDRRNSEIGKDATIILRTMPANKWESICLPFSVSEREMKRVFGDDYVLLTCDGVTESKRLHFIRHANRYIEAGRPYLIKPSQNVESLTFHNVSIEGTATVRNKADNTDIKVTDPSRFNVDVNDNEFIFRGIYKRETAPKNSYFADTKYNDGDGLYKLTADGKIGGYRAYFTVQDGSSSTQSLSLALGYDDLTPENISNDEPTSILIIEGSTNNIHEVSGSEAIYTINGQKYSNNPLDLNNAPSGIYIVGGHTVVK